MTNNKRIESLDSLRGLASLSVVFNHLFLAIPYFFTARSLTAVLWVDSPLHIIWAGQEAVILFFVLSGFVLALPFLSSRRPTYTRYITRRFCRIYIPYIIAVAIAIFVFAAISPKPISNMSANFNHQWSHPVSLKSMVSCVFMLGFDTFNINGPIWSLVHEMRISVFFPLIVILVQRYNWKKSLLYGISSSLIIWILLYMGSSVLPVRSAPRFLMQTFGDTFYYTSFFIMGATLAKYREQATSWISKLDWKSKTIVVVMAIVLYNFEWFRSVNLSPYVPFFTPYAISGLTTSVVDFATAISVVFLFMFALSSVRVQSILKRRPLVNLGRLSYSLYLIHMIVILTMFHILSPFFPRYVIAILVPIASILLATSFYFLVEKPSTTLGKYLASLSLTQDKSVSLNKLDA